MIVNTPLWQRIYLWRGDLSPLGCVAAPKFGASVCQAE